MCQDGNWTRGCLPIVVKQLMSYLGNFKKNEDFSVIKFFVNLKDDIHIHFI